MSDIYSNVKVTRVYGPVAAGTTGTKTGAVIDTAGYRSTTFVIGSGAQTTTGITVTPVVKSGSATGSLASCSDTVLQNTEAAAASTLAGSAGANKRAKIGYIGSDRYVSCNLVVAGAATGVYYIDAIQSDAIKAPV